MNRKVLMVAFALALAVGSPAFAVTITQIGSGGFTGAATTIGFEGALGDGDRRTADYLVIGGTEVWGGSVATDGTQGIPVGLAHSGVHSFLRLDTGGIHVRFATPMNRVGAFFIGTQQAGDVKMILYATETEVLGSVTGSLPADEGVRTVLNMETGFVGAQSDAGIAGVVFQVTGRNSPPDISIDDLVFEAGLAQLPPANPPPQCPVPEPATMLLLSAGLMGAGVLRRRNK